MRTEVHNLSVGLFATLFFLSGRLFAQPISADILQEPRKAQWIRALVQTINRFTVTSDLTLRDYAVINRETL